jgi:hypothetical protein
MWEERDRTQRENARRFFANLAANDPLQGRDHRFPWRRVAFGCVLVLVAVGLAVAAVVY